MSTSRLLFKLLTKLPEQVERLGKTVQDHPFLQESFWQEVKHSYQGQDPKVKHYYSVLELPYGASTTEIKQAYKRLMKIYHPDKFQNLEKKQAANSLVQKINEAYRALLTYTEAQSGK
ncbi:MAG: DnaJ domain-containing protein [Trueperaceae bacterium]|nr:DnaJ domain-containing protein [Trueperaceae bacterium]